LRDDFTAKHRLGEEDNVVLRPGRNNLALCLHGLANGYQPSRGSRKGGQTQVVGDAETFCEDVIRVRAAYWVIPVREQGQESGTV